MLVWCNTAIVAWLAGVSVAVLDQPAAESEPIFQQSFDDASSIDAIAPIARARNVEIIRGPIDPDNSVLRVTFNAGDHYGGSFSVRTAEHMNEEPTRIAFRYRLFLEPSWQPEHSGKLPGFGGTYGVAGWGGKPSDGSNGWSSRGMFGPIDDQGRTPIGSYIYHADMVDEGRTYGVGEWWNVRIERGRWYTIVQEVRLDSIGEDGGNADGWLRAWVDGELVFDRQGLHLRDTDRLRIERVWANFYYGGKVAAPSTMSVLIDDLAVFINGAHAGASPAVQSSSDR